MQKQLLLKNGVQILTVSDFFVIWCQGYITLEQSIKNSIWTHAELKKNNKLMIKLSLE